MRQQTINHAEYHQIVQEYKRTGRRFLEDHTVTCYRWPLRDVRFGQLVITNKDFYAGVPDISEDKSDG